MRFLRFFLLQVEAAQSLSLHSILTKNGTKLFSYFRPMDLKWVCQIKLKKLCTLNFEMFGFWVFHKTGQVRTAETYERRTQLAVWLTQSISSASKQLIRASASAVKAKKTEKFSLCLSKSRSAPDVNIEQKCNFTFACSVFTKNLYKNVNCQWCLLRPL